MYPLGPPQDSSGDTVLLVSTGNTPPERGSGGLATTAVHNTDRTIEREQCILKGSASDDTFSHKGLIPKGDIPRDPAHYIHDYPK